MFKDENGTFIMFAPALNLSSYGSSLEDVQRSFSETLQIFIEELHQSGELVKELYDLGWRLQKTSDTAFKPPYFRSNNEIAERIADQDYKIDPHLVTQSRRSISIPVN